MSIYRVYVTFYLGNKLPPFYIGSTKEDRLNSGYHGSVRSQKYRTVWESELKNHPEHFKTIPLSTRYTTQKEAIEVESRLQQRLNVIKSDMYVNMSIASKDGCFGRDVSGENHPLFGVGHSATSRQKISLNHADVSGKNNGRARWFRFTAPNGDVYEVLGEFKKFCAEMNLPLGTMSHVVNGRFFTKGKCAGWKCERV